MKATLRLALRYLFHHRWRSGALATGVALAFFFPLVLNLLVTNFTEQLEARAASTPLVCGAKGSRYDLVLDALYFRGRVTNAITFEEVDSVLDSELGLPIPIVANRSAREHRLVGTVLEYFEFRKLRAERGRLPLWLGETVLGSTCAENLGLAPGDTLLTDHENLYDLSKGSPLKLRIVGVLAPTGTADDEVLFCNYKTAWIADGLAHGHLGAETQAESSILSRIDDQIALDASVEEFVEITAENADSFHLHEEESELPLTGMLVVPLDRRSETKLKGRLRLSPDVQLIEPMSVIEELLGFVFQIKRFFDANSLLAGCAVAVFFGLIVVLSLQSRQRELEVYSKLGVSAGRVAAILTTEFALVIAAGFVIALILAYVVALVNEPIGAVLP